MVCVEVEYECKVDISIGVIFDPFGVELVAIIWHWNSDQTGAYRAKLCIEMSWEVVDIDGRYEVMRIE